MIATRQPFRRAQIDVEVGMFTRDKDFILQTPSLTPLFPRKEQRCRTFAPRMQALYRAICSQILDSNCVHLNLPSSQDSAPPTLPQTQGTRILDTSTTNLPPPTTSNLSHGEQNPAAHALVPQRLARRARCLDARSPPAALRARPRRPRLQRPRTPRVPAEDPRLVAKKPHHPRWRLDPAGERCHNRVSL